MHTRTLQTMQIHEVHQESRDIFAISLATGTEPQIPGLSRDNRDGWYVLYPSLTQWCVMYYYSLVHCNPKLQVTWWLIHLFLLLFFFLHCYVVLSLVDFLMEQVHHTEPYVRTLYDMYSLTVYVLAACTVQHCRVTDHAGANRCEWVQHVLFASRLRCTWHDSTQKNKNKRGLKIIYQRQVSEFVLACVVPPSSIPCTQSIMTAGVMAADLTKGESPCEKFYGCTKCKARSTPELATSQLGGRPYQLYGCAKCKAARCTPDLQSLQLAAFLRTFDFWLANLPTHSTCAWFLCLAAKRTLTACFWLANLRTHATSFWLANHYVFLFFWQLNAPLPDMLMACESSLGMHTIYTLLLHVFVMRKDPLGS